MRRAVIIGLSRLLVLVGLALYGVKPIDAATITGPDGLVRVTVQISSGNLTCSVAYRGTTVIETSALGLTVNGTNLGSGVTISGAAAYSTNEAFLSRQGIHAVGLNHYEAQLVGLNHAASGLDYFLNVRAFSNGVAFRYEFTNSAAKNITAESTSFVIPDGSTVWSQNNTSVYEGVYHGANIDALTNNAVMGPPVTIELAGTNGFLALTESTPGLFGNPCLAKVADATGRKIQVTYPSNSDGSTGVSASGVMSTPWNVILIGPDLNSLVNNDIVESLAPPPEAALFPEGAAAAWGSPGRSVWDWLQPQPGGITWTNAMTNSLWASRLGFEYNTVDNGWSSWNGGDPWPQVREVVNFSHGAGVKVLLWKTASELNTYSQRTNFFQQLQTYGGDGFKADFFDFNSVSASAKERVKLQEDILRDAAAGHLLVNFHGSTKPAGQFRTWPNLIQMEAVFGKEQYLSSVAAMPVPFTRFLAGPADFTPMLLSGQPAYEIANAVNMPGPIITYAERSDIIAKSPYASLIRAIPSMWDETVVLPQSKLGVTVATARRKGQDWFIGIMNTVVTQSWTLPLTFLCPNTNYTAQLIRETSTNLERTNVTSGSVLSVAITNTGASGFVARIFQEPPFTVSPGQLLSGTTIGTSGSFGNGGNTREKVFDGSLATFFDAPATSGAWVGLDLGAANQKAVTFLRYCPRANWSARMLAGLFQGANAADFSDAAALHFVGYVPPEGMFTTVTLTNRTVYRYLRYLGPANGSCNVAEIQFYGVLTTRTNLVAQITPTNTLAVSWPVTHTGWRLQTQVLDVQTGLTSSWSDVAGSVSNYLMQFPVNQTGAGALYRLVYP